MKNLKFIYAFAFVCLLFSSCSEESVDVQEAEQGQDLELVLEKYPKEITIDNWEEFVYAPVEVINYFNQKELKLKKPQKETKGTDFDQKRVILNNFLLGEVQVIGNGINPSTNFLGGTGVRITGTTSTTNGTSNSTPFFQGQNFFLSNISGLICFYHQGNSSGTFAPTEWTNGVTTSDLIAIQRHILGITPFTELWQYLAADVNGDGSVDVGDIVVIRRLILGITLELPAMSSGFYNQPVIYFPQDEYVTVNANLASNLPFITLFYPTLTCQSNIGNSDTDRFAIKRGDLNGNWNF